MIVSVDSNVIIDVLNVDERWHGWSRRIVDSLLMDDNDLVISHVVLAEIASNFASLGEAVALLKRSDIELLSLDAESAFAAGQVFRSYRRIRSDGSSGKAILADFLIGAHARNIGASLLTRDPVLYRRYFPDLSLITPETHP